MDGSQTSLTRKRKRENPNIPIDEQDNGKGEALCSADIAKTNVERDEIDAQDQMEQFDETSRKKGTILQQRKMSAKRSFSDYWTQNSSEILGNIEFCEPPHVFSCVRLSNSIAYDVNVRRMSNLRGIMEALTDHDVNIIGVCGSDDIEKSDTVEKVSRRAQRDNLFDVIIMASVTQKQDLKRLQGELADALGLNLIDKSVAKRARCLRDRIKQEQKILVILQDLFKGLDLDKVGIPSGADHTGCKILLTSISEEILSNQMQAQKVFMA